MKRVIAILLVTTVAGATTIWAQPPQGSAAATKDTPPAVDPTKLGVSLDRIRRELEQAEVKEHSEGEPLRLRFVVEVYGQAPKIDLLKDFPLIGPVPYGAPTHQEVVDFLTPQEFRSPPFPISSLAYWVAQQLSQRSKRQRCEQEIAEYKRLVMAGVAVAAPRCTQ